ncbi:MAG: excinuclease ABC subunit UvrC [Candidatus Hydrogenedentes bacterium]|nr:excinuclease ABC subunit UvrC [Candidatus Hydrogenedentota bacterium]
MANVPEIAAHERLDLEGLPSKRLSAEEFLASFDMARVPTSPGCYIMRDEKDRVIYVGKANNLRSRVRAYINESDTRYTVKFLMRRVAHIDFLLTTNEKEALLLENSLIKEHRPRYNVQLKDDKTYVSLRINLPHEFPRVTVTRNLRKDGSRYFGPYSSAGAVRETIKQIQRLFPLRLCSDSVLRNRTRPCLYHQMKQCSAPCVGYIEREAYRELVDQVIMVLEGRSAELERLLMQRIQQHAERLEFEKAAEVRDRVYALRTTLERQRTVRSMGEGDQDVFGVFTQGRFSEIQVLFFRGGKMMGGRSFSFNQREMPLEEVLSSFLLQYYSEMSTVPSEILLPLELEDSATLAELFSEQRGTKITVHWPQRGEKRALIDLAARNAKNRFEEKRLAEQANRDLVAQLREKLRLRAVPNRIECFDISTIQGTQAVGSMVTFEGGAPAKSRYRRFAIKMVEGQDDFAMMREVLLRRFKRAIEESDLPDLVMIDGGKGQLNVATTVFKDLGIEDLEAVGIAKSRTLDAGGHSPERFFLPGRKDPIILPQNSPVVLFLARIRDEAHRFAVTYHRKRRGKATLSSALTSIPGVGPKRARMLLNSLGSLAKVRSATLDEIAALPGFSAELAQAIKEHLTASDSTPEETDAS